MRVVAKNSDADLARRRAEEEVRWALRELTANLLRVVRGAGRPGEIGRQAQTLVETFIDYREAVGTFPPAYDLTSFLSADHDEEVLACQSAFDRDPGSACKRDPHLGLC